MNVHFSSKTNEWATPQDFYDLLNKEFNFTLDPCATKETAKCKRFFTQAMNGLAQSWKNERVFCNPPYGREIGKWVKKASEAQGGGSRHAYTGTNGHQILSPVYLSEVRRGDPFYQRSIEVWRMCQFRTVS